MRLEGVVCQIASNIIAWTEKFGSTTQGEKWSKDTNLEHESGKNSGLK
jgi:hypothetical protein